MFIILFDGDLPRTRGLVAPEAYKTLDAVNARLKELFIDAVKPHWGGPWLPDPEDDRVLVFQADPDASPSMKVVWAFLGTHWSWDEPPGVDSATSELPGIGSLMTMANT